jgi:hypothetical protein
MKRLVCLTAMLAAGCSTASKDISASYVSPLQYQNFTCDQFAFESSRVQTRANQLAGRLDAAAENDKTITAVGAILFWPALFALGGTKEQETEYGRLKGEYDAIQQAAMYKGCTGPWTPGQQATSVPSAATGATAVPASASVPATTPAVSQ